VLYETVSDGIAGGAFAAVDPLQASFNFWCMVHGVVSLIIAKTGIDWGDRMTLIEGAMDQAIEGIRPSPRPERTTHAARATRTPAKDAKAKGAKPKPAAKAKRSHPKVDAAPR